MTVVEPNDVEDDGDSVGGDRPLFCGRLEKIAAVTESFSHDSEGVLPPAKFIHYYH